MFFIFICFVVKYCKETQLNGDKIESKLNSGVNKIWQDIQQKLSQFFRSMCLDHFKFDELIDMLTIINR